ncbi:MAG: ATP-binding cassette domain-containing protein [Acidimicrobiaceae bacterium]|nr:ATP-binding cassette domain-containing protein [Acidimicrobiia bacterium]MCY4495279.1 ATP-binding cassette domain-containing protein [Acidimicrobiaceae bacterium]
MSAEVRRRRLEPVQIEVRGVVRRDAFTLSLDVALDQERIAVVGPNGAGKTTLLRLIAGLERLWTGELKIDGQLLDDGSSTFIAAHQRSVALAFQDHRLFGHLRIIDNVAYPLRRAGLKRAAARELAAGHLASVGLTDVAVMRPAQLSGGQRQRASIARALATPAQVLLLDEPLASVDDQSRTALRNLLINADHRTVVWVTHDPDDAKYADSTVTLPPNNT